MRRNVLFALLDSSAARVKIHYPAMQATFVLVAQAVQCQRAGCNLLMPPPTSQYHLSPQLYLKFASTEFLPMSLTDSVPLRIFALVRRRLRFRVLLGLFRTRPVYLLRCSAQIVHQGCTVLAAAGAHREVPVQPDSFVPEMPARRGQPMDCVPRVATVWKVLSSHCLARLEPSRTRLASLQKRSVNRALGGRLALGSGRLHRVHLVTIVYLARILRCQ